MGVIADTLKTSNKLDLVMLGLANACYQHQGGKGSGNVGRAEAVEKYVQALPAVPGPNGETLEGYFKVEWGPGETDKNSNLAYVASYRPGVRPVSSADEAAPEFFVVAIRGTDINADPIAVFTQIVEDFKSFTLDNWKDHLNSKHKSDSPIVYDIGRVASGTVLGFERIVNMKDELTHNGVSMIDKLKEITAGANSHVPVMVTGHSLGGGQTQVMASYLAWQLDGKGTSSDKGQPSRVIPVAFAPPTAGDVTFASIYTEWFPNNRYWMNKLDLVPQAFWNLIWTKKNLWDGYKFADSERIVWPAGSKWPVSGQDVVNYGGSPGPGLPEWLKLLIPDSFLEHVERLGYARPDTGLYEVNKAQVLPQPQHINEVFSNITKPTTSVAMLEWQHFPPAYHEYIKTDYPQVVDYVWPRINPKG